METEDAAACHSYGLSCLADNRKHLNTLLFVPCSVDEDGTVRAHAIYEPPQTGSADSLSLERGTEEEGVAEAIAAAQGWKKVGWIYSQSTKEREFIVSTEELCQMAACQVGRVPTLGWSEGIVTPDAHPRNGPMSWKYRRPVLHAVFECCLSPRSPQDEMGDTAVTALVAAFPGEDGQAEVHVEVGLREAFALVLAWFACGVRAWNAHIQCPGGGAGSPYAFGFSKSSPSLCPFRSPSMTQAFQVSRQCVKLWRAGWFQEQAEPSGLSTLRDPKVRPRRVRWLGSGVGCEEKPEATRLRVTLDPTPGGTAPGD